MAISPAELQNKLAAIPIAQKILAVAGIAATIAVVIAVMLWANQPVYHLLYSNLSAEDAGAITEKLREMKVPYEIKDGNAILVPGEKVYELRLLLAGQGIPSGGGVGFELFDRTTIGMTDFVQKLNYKRALQGELARTIGQLAEVEHARVHLAVPEKTLFSDKKDTARASVVLKLRGGRTLSQNQVQGVVHLVASSVEGLGAENITVVDTLGNVLSRPSDDSYGTQLTNYQTEHQRGLEKSMEERVQSMLERAVGTGKAVVRVSSTLDFKQIETTEEKYDPDSAAVRSEQRVQENSSGSSASASGVPGVVSNLPGAKNENPQAVGDKGGASSQSKRAQETINYEINKTVNHIVGPVGTIKRLSAAVLIDGNYEPAKGADGKETRKYIPRTEEEITKYTEIVKKAIGYSEERGDQVEVLSIPFESNISVSEGEVEKKSSFQITAILPFIKYVAALLVAALVFLFIVKPLMKTILAPNPGMGMLPGGMGGSGVFPRVSEMEGGTLPMQLQVDSDVKARDEIVKIARENPQQTAKLIKSWMSEK
ncbi:MAG: flagellar M-ring protein FliF [Nitrospirae bacterium]|nr:flagellar M-ring protein FliF [Nitrospirota bacterium]